VVGLIGLTVWPLEGVKLFSVLMAKPTKIVVYFKQIGTIMILVGFVVIKAFPDLQEMNYLKLL